MSALNGLLKLKLHALTWMNHGCTLHHLKAEVIRYFLRHPASQLLRGRRRRLICSLSPSSRGSCRVENAFEEALILTCVMLQLRRAGVEVLQRVPNGGSSNVVPNRGRDDSSEPSEKKSDFDVVQSAPIKDVCFHPRTGRRPINANYCKNPTKPKALAMAAGCDAQMIVETWSRGGLHRPALASNAIHQTGIGIFALSQTKIQKQSMNQLWRNHRTAGNCHRRAGRSNGEVDGDRFFV
ncbi:hypothetical protein HAX54_001703 [Datura stramonium]|uniref:Uncharacterized protein n=1 Tax=Datura stramonium TaxID=4076 RepID=A0ABS8WSZ8_DATST|nr:hypothetical protein [Datura stramonium]